MTDMAPLDTDIYFHRRITRTEIPFDQSDKAQLIADHNLCEHKQN